MVINRFHKFAQNDYSMKHYAPEVFLPDFEAWDSLLASQQTKYDTAMSLKNKYPKYLESRQDLAAQYMQEADASINDITTQYTEKGVTAGNKALRDLGMNLNKQWQPGGLAYELENEYNDYQKAAAEIDKYYKDNKAENSANRDYSLAALKNHVKQPLEKNPVTGLYTRKAISPEIIPYVDISEEALKVVSQIKESGTTDIVKLNPYWFEKITKEGVTKETVKAVTDALLEQPKYQQQQQVELWKMKQSMTPEQQQLMVDKAKTNFVNDVNGKLEELTALSNSKDKNEVKNLQRQLAEAGLYSGEIDGNFGPKSKEALNTYINKTKESAKEKSEKTSIDGLLTQQLKNNYAKPLIAAFSREKVDKDLIFNQETALKAKLAAQRDQTSKLVGAIQSLAPVPTSDYLVTPGQAAPMETLDKMKTSADENIKAANGVFGTIVKNSNIATLAGTSDPVAINEITQLRLQSKDAKDFATKLMANGFVNIDPNKASKLYDFYSSPDAVSLNNAYSALAEASAQKKSLTDAELSVSGEFAKSKEGKKELDRIREKVDFKGSDEQLLQLIVNDDPSLNKERKYKPGLASKYGNVNVKEQTIVEGNYSNYFKAKRDEYAKANKLELPTSIRGYTVNASSGYGKNLEGLIKDDIQSGYTLGYEGINFKKLGTDESVDKKDVNLDKMDIKLNVAGDVITYYITGKTNNSKNPELVTTAARAPKEQYAKLNTLALDMKKQATETNDAQLDALANNLFRVTSGGSVMEDASNDQTVVSTRNGKRLNNVIDPTRSNRETTTTFNDNEDVIGIPIGSEREVGNKTFMKFKVSDPKNGGQRYMQTVKTYRKDNKGVTHEYYLPVRNRNGGLYYDSSSEAENVIIDLQMKDMIGVEINQQKVSNTNITEKEQAGLMLGIQSQLNNDE